ncbi:hypothetical protein [Rhizobium giardinii]|uniref:hypothetical protein n=1 Tax=Rhizobium giardinii TaxID=56731 RepID=UPI003D6DEE33
MVVKFINRKNEIRDALLCVAKEGQPMTYESFGEMVSIWRMRGAKDLLDLIAKEERAKKEPDITYMLRSATTKYPSQIGGQPAKPPTTEQKQLAREEMQAVIDRHCPGAVNPY